jgi:hypothetical protein
LVTANDGDNTISVLLGKGDGSFGSAVSYAASGPAVSVAVAKLRGGSIADILVSTYTGGTVDIFSGAGDGTFTRTSTVSVSGAYGAAVADLNGDGTLDVAAVGSGGISVFNGTCP